MSSTSQTSLKNFFIFNPSLAKKEGEERKKLLYYYPPNIDTDLQVKNAGLCEALIKFTASFLPDRPCEAFTTEKTKQLLYQPEPGFWIVMTATASSSGCSENDPSEIIQDNVCDAVLRLAYRMFTIFSGTFRYIVGTEESDESLEILRKKLDKFYNKYLLTINLENSNILDIFQGIQFLPLGKEPFLHVLGFINLVEVTFPSVRHSMFLYNDHLVWSGIAPEDMQVLYHYLVHSLLPSHPDLELQGGSLPGSSPAVHYGSFVTGPPDLQHSVVSSKRVPKVHLKKDQSSMQCFHLVVYRALSATLCLFLLDETDLNLQLFKALDDHIGPRLTSLVSEVSEHCVRNSPTNSDIGPRFIYFNKLNLAIKSSVLEPRKGGSPTLPPEVMRILVDMNAHQDKFCDDGEVIAKTCSDTWIIAKFSNGREFYVVTQKKASLMEIGVEVKKICDTQLKGIFFMD